MPNDEVELFVHVVPGDAGIYYLRYLSESAGQVLIMLLESRLETAVFILGKEDLQLARLNEPDRHRIRFQFPEFFRDR